MNKITDGYENLADNTAYNIIDLVLFPQIELCFNGEHRSKEWCYYVLVMTVANIINHVLDSTNIDGYVPEIVDIDMLKRWFNNTTTCPFYQASAFGRTPNEWLSTYYCDDSLIKQKADLFVSCVDPMYEKEFINLKQKASIWQYANMRFLFYLLDYSRSIVIATLFGSEGLYNNYWYDCFAFAKAIGKKNN